MRAALTRCLACAQEAQRKEAALVQLLPAVDALASRLDGLEEAVQALDKASLKLLKRAQSLKPAPDRS